MACYGDTVEQRHSFRQIWEYDYSNADEEKSRMIQNLVEIDFDHERAYSIDFDGTAITLYVLKWPTFTIGLTEEFGTPLAYEVLETVAFTPTTFLAEQTQNITEYDEKLVRRLIEKITVYGERGYCRIQIRHKRGCKKITFV